MKKPNFESRASTMLFRGIAKSPFIRQAYRSAAGVLQGTAVLSIAFFSLFGFNSTLLAVTDTWIGNTSVNFADSNWALSGNNPPVTGDSLAFGAAGSAGSSLVDNLMTQATFTINGITFALGGSAYTINPGTVGTNGFTLGSGANIVNRSSSTDVINDAIALTGINDLTTDTSGGNLTFGGIISGAGAGVLVNGGGTVVFDQSSSNTYTGNTSVTAGVLNLNFSNLSSGGLISSSSPLSLGGSTLQIVGNASAASSQAFASTTLSAGANTITAGPGSGSNNPTVSLAALGTNVAAGATLVLNGPATNSNASTAGGTNDTAEAALGSSSAGAVASTGTFTTTTAGLQGSSNVDGWGLLGNSQNIGYATIGLYDWATTDTTAGVAGTNPFTIMGGSQVAGFYFILNGATPAGASTISTNYDVTGNSTLNGGNTIQASTYRFNTNAAITVGVNTGSGAGNPVDVSGILLTPNVGQHNITFTASASDGLDGGGGHDGGINDINLFQNNPSGEVIFSQSSTAANGNYNGNTFTQSGWGTVSFLGINNYTGNTYLNGGVLEYAKTTSLGTNYANPVNLNGGTLVANLTANFDNGTTDRPVVLGNNGGGIGATSGNTLTVDGLVSGAGPLTIGIPATNGALGSPNNGNIIGQLPGTGTGTANAQVLAGGIVILSDASNTFGGGITIDSGALEITGALGQLGAGAVALNGGTFEWGNATTTDISSLGVSVLSNGGTFNTNGNNVSFANAIGGSGILTKSGAGALTLNGNNTFSGGVTVSSGTLAVAGANTYTGPTNIGTGTLTLASGGSLGNTAVTIGSGATLSALTGNAGILGGVTGNNNSIFSLEDGAIGSLGISGGLTLNGADAFGLDLLGGTGIDSLSISGGALLGSGTASISLANLGGTAPANNTVYNFLTDASGLGSITFKLNSTSITISGNTYALSLIQTSTTEGIEISSAALNFYWTGTSSTWGSIGNFATDHGGLTPQSGSLSASSNVFETADSASNFTQTLDGTYTINSLNFTGVGTVAATNSITLGAGSGGTLTIAAVNAYSDAANNVYAVGTGLVVQPGSAAHSITANIALGNSQVWELNNSSSNPLTIGGQISDGSTLDSLTINGTGELILNAGNTYDGGTTVSGNATLKLGIANALNVTSGLTVSGTGTVDLAGENQSLSSLSDGGVSTGTIESSTGSATLSVNNSAPNTFSGKLTDSNSSNGSSFGITLAGTSSVTLSGSNSYSGPTTVNAGTLTAANNSALGVGTSSFGGLTLNPSSSGTATVNFTSSTPSIASLSSTSAGTSNIVLGNIASGGSATTLNVGGGGATTIFSGVISDRSATAAAAIGNFNVTGGSLTLNGADTYTGTTTVSGGSLILGNSLALQNSTLNYNNQGGTLSFGALTGATFAGLTGGQNLALSNTSAAPVALTVNLSGTQTYTGSLSGPGSLTMGKAGSLTLTNANYTGGTTITSGSLTFTGGNVGSSTSVVNIATPNVGLNVSGGTITGSALDIGLVGGQTGAGIEITGNASASFTSVLLGSASNTAGAFTINTTGSVSLGNVSVVRDNGGTGNGLIVNNGAVTATSVQVQGNSNKSANLAINGGSLVIGNGTSTGAFEIGTAGSGANLLSMTAGSLTYLGTDGLLVSPGANVAASTVITGGTATFTGITLNAGSGATDTSTLSVSGGASLYLGSAGLVINLPGATVSGTFGTATIGAIASWNSSAPITLAGSTGPTNFQAADASGNADNITLTGTLSGSGPVAISGAGVVTLGGPDSYTGATTVNTGGTLIVTGSLSGTVSTTVSGKLAGTGSINGATLTGGTLALGFTLASTAVGTLTSTANISLDSASTLSFRLGLNSATDSDQLAITNSGSLTLNNSLLSIVVGPNATAGTLYDLVTGGAGSTGTGTDVFSNAPTIGSNFVYTNAQGDSFNIYYATDAANDGSVGGFIDAQLVSVVPEPGTWASLISGAGVLLVFQRCRRRRS